MKNEFIEARVLGLAEEGSPEVLLQLVLLQPVDWMSADPQGQPACSQMHIRLVVEHLDPAMAIECRFVRLVSENERSVFPAYVLAVRPVLIGGETDPDRFLHEDVLLTLVHEAGLCGRDWARDVGIVEVFWDHRRDAIEKVRNACYARPAEPILALPPPSDDEPSLESLFGQFDAACDAVDDAPPFSPPVPAEADPGIALSEDDIEVIVESIRPEASERLQAQPPPPPAARMRHESFGYDVYLIHGQEFVEEFDLDEALRQSA